MGKDSKPESAGDVWFFGQDGLAYIWAGTRPAGNTAAAAVALHAVSKGTCRRCWLPIEGFEGAPGGNPRARVHRSPEACIALMLRKLLDYFEKAEREPGL